MTTLGVDIGSSSIKVLLYNADEARVLSLHSRPLDSRVTNIPAHRYEEDPGRIRELTFEVIREAAVDAQRLNRTIDRIAFTGQMHGGLFVDENFRALTNCITWQDKRCDEQVPDGRKLIDEIRDLVGSDSWDETGGKIFTGFLSATIYWFVKHDRVPEATHKIIGIYEWLASELCGMAFTDPSSASAWGIYSIKLMGWSKEITQALHIQKKWLPEVVPTGARVGRITQAMAQLLGLSNEVEIVSGMGDTQASYLGSGCRADEVLINFGTGSQAMWERDQFARFLETDIRASATGKYLITVPTLSGGQAYALLADLIAETIETFTGQKPDRDAIYRIMNDLALEPQLGEALLVTPYFNGSRTKGEELRASISNISRENFHIRNLIRATLEGMVAEIALPYLQLPKEERKHIGIVASGNGIRRNPALREIAQSVFKLPIRLSNIEEEAALGAAMLCSRRAFVRGTESRPYSLGGS